MTEKKREANREGDVWERGDGRWCGRVYPPEPGSKPKYVYGRSRAEARKNKKKLESELAQGMPATDQKLSDYLERWITETLVQEVSAGQLAESTADSYADNTRKHIIPDLGAIPLRELTVSRVRRWLLDLADKPSGRPRRKLRRGEKGLPLPLPLSSRTVAYCHTILRRALNDARRELLVSQNVAALVKPPKVRRRERAALTKTETAALLAASSEDRWWCYWLVALTLGLRRGEGLALRWDDVDWDAKTITLSLTVQRVRGPADPQTGRRKGRLVAKAMKTDASAATVPVGDGLLEALRAHEKEQKRERMRARVWLDAGLIFTTHVGTAIEPRNINRAWNAICAKASVAGARLHDLRHACGTYLADAGIHPKAIQTTLRHSRMATTEIYVHALEEMNRDAAEAIDKIVTRLRAVPGGGEAKSS